MLILHKESSHPRAPRRVSLSIPCFQGWPSRGLYPSHYLPYTSTRRNSYPLAFGCKTYLVRRFLSQVGLNIQKRTSRTMGPGLRPDSQPRYTLLSILLGPSSNSHLTLLKPLHNRVSRGTAPISDTSFRSDPLNLPKCHTCVILHDLGNVSSVSTATDVDSSALTNTFRSTRASF
jgi:hypothetical protein